MQSSNSSSYLKAKNSLLSRFRWIMLVLMTLGTLIPAALFSVSNYQYVTGNSDPRKLNSILSIAALLLVLCAVSVFMGVIILPARNFAYLLNREKTDMIYALPVTRKKRFFSDFLMGILDYVLPFAVLSLISMLIILIPTSTRLDGNILNYTTISAGEAWVIWADLNIGSLFACCFSVFVLQFVGNKLDYYVYLFLLLVSVPLDFVCLGEKLGQGLHATTMGGLYAPVFVTNPLGFLLNLGNGILYNADSTSGILVPPLVKYIVAALVMVLLVFLAFRMHLNRKAEQTGKGIIFRGALYFLVASVGIITGSLATTATGIVSAVIVFILMSLFLTRAKMNLRKFWNILIPYAAFMAVPLLTGFISSKTEAFDMENYRPAAADISSVSVSCDPYTDLKFRNQETIQDIEKLDVPEHFDNAENERRIVPDSDDETDMRHYVYITYHMKNGIAINRQLIYNNADIIAFRKFLFSSQDFADSTADEIIGDMEQTITGNGRGNYSDDAVSCSATFIPEVYTFTDDGDTTYFTINSNQELVPVDGDAFKEGVYSVPGDQVADYISDLKRAIRKDYIRDFPEEDAKYQIGTKLYVSEKDKNILAVLRKYNILDSKGNLNALFSEDEETED